MHKIEWSDELSLGVEEIDGQHKELIRIANEVITAVTEELGPSVVDSIIHRLREYTVYHFNSEEQLMRDAFYPHVSAHTDEHGKLRDKVKEYQRLLYLQKKVTPKDVLDFMKAWLLEHILSTDRELAKFIHEQDEKRAQMEAERDQE